MVGIKGQLLIFQGLIGNSWQEEIYISNDKYYEQLVQYENEKELIQPVEDEN